MTSDPTEASVPDQAPSAGPTDAVPDPEQGGAPRTDIGSAPALQPRDSGGGSDMLT